MVLLTITPTIQSAIELYNQLSGHGYDESSSTEPSLKEPAVGGPVSHAQLIQISRFLRSRKGDEKRNEYRLDALLKGANIHIAPPPPKPQPTPEYTALMTRLRAEAEHRAYDLMLNPPAPTSLPATTYIAPQDLDDLDVTYADVNRQLALILNVLVSIIACSVAIWIAARHWSVPQRLGLSMLGSATVAFAEVAIYFGYIRRVRDAKALEKKKVEEKEVVETWVIGKKKEEKVGGFRNRKSKYG